VLTSNAPETKDNDFTWKDFQAKNNSELLAIFGNFINRTLVLTHKYFEGRVPAAQDINPEDQKVLDEINTFPGRVGGSLDNFRFREALAEMMNLARLGNKYLTDSEPWQVIKTDEERVKTILNISLQICANLSILCGPFLPFTAERLAGMLNLQQLHWAEAGQTDLLKAGHQLNQPEYLFERIDDKAIEAQVQKLLDTRKLNEGAAMNIAPMKDRIPYEDFARLDIRVGTILEAEKVPKTQKLLKLKIDTGIDQRTIVSGIAEDYDPKDIIGQKACFLVNLEPRTIRGIESDGMILMAEGPDGGLCFIMPSEEFDNGSTVS
jgi:methionyl-tRNA synthetase